MDVFGETLARIARDTMMELVSRGLTATPKHYQQVFLDLYGSRGLPPERIVDFVVDSGDDAPSGGEPGALEIRGLITLAVGLADAGGVACAGNPDVAAAFQEIKETICGGDELTDGVVRELVGRLDEATVDLDAGASGTVDAGLMKAVGGVVRALVPLADPEGRYRDDVLPALGALGGGGGAGDLTGHLQALERFAAQRRSEVAAEVKERKRLQKRANEVEALALSSMDLVSRAMDDDAGLVQDLAGARAALPSADASTVSELKEQLDAHRKRLEGQKAPLTQQKDIIKGVLQTLADQLSSATSGSEAFEEGVSQIRSRLEAANDLTELRELQETLVREAANAAAEAGKMKAQLGDLSTQVEQSQKQVEALEQALEETKAKVGVDPLTQVPNRGALEEWVGETLYTGDKLVRGFSLLVLDLDKFKSVNDTHGHLAGDKVLVEAAKRFKSGIREIDFLARYGGEEFVLVLPDCNLRIAHAVAERIRVLLSRRPIDAEGASLTQTTSIGVATARGGEPFKAVFERADQCVYIAKEQGRNRAIIESQLPGS